MRRVSVLVLLLFFGFVSAVTVAVPVGAAEKPAKKTAVVADGKTVKVDYTLTVDGKVVDSTKGRPPMEFKEGAHQVIPGFEKAVMGMKVGQKKSFTVKPAEGYGQVNPKAFQEVSRKQLPSDTTPKAGMILFAKAKDGQRIPVTIKEVKKDSVVIDFNHPLAGKTLHFNVEVVDVK
jgi:FKBP-type peptidyl-prolyl cis-trans isomerase SlyD